MTAKKAPKANAATDSEQPATESVAATTSTPKPRPVWEGGQTRAEYHAAVVSWKKAHRSK